MQPDWDSLSGVFFERWVFAAGAGGEPERGFFGRSGKG